MYRWVFLWALLAVLACGENELRVLPASEQEPGRDVVEVDVASRGGGMGGMIMISNKREIVKPGQTLRLNIQYMVSHRADIAYYIKEVGAAGFNKFKRTRVPMAMPARSITLLLQNFDKPLRNGRFYLVQADLLKANAPFNQKIDSDQYVARADSRPTPPNRNSLVIAPHVNRGKITGNGPYYIKLNWGTTKQADLILTLRRKGNNNVIDKSTTRVPRGYGLTGVGALEFKGLTSRQGPYEVTAQIRHVGGGVVQTRKQTVNLRTYDNVLIVTEFTAIPSRGPFRVRVYWVAKSNVKEGRNILLELRNPNRRITASLREVRPGPGSAQFTLNYGGLNTNTYYIVRASVNSKNGRTQITDSRSVVIEN
ncbi:hypothetical protein NDN08_002063 [Rhodosorus marinus]|uniref:Fibronectin type-III domain-containing protein n=1 Tax=Rhodosorus marinus TaxID=101924 RepID=A0AAV8USN7_9RHOD|nr:hypothetical protein NDN08_002063 [Rhodosorus marinus]